MATKVGPLNNQEHAKISKRYPSISWQILVAVLITVVAVLGVSSFVELNLLKKRETQRLQQKGVVTADRIANSLAYPLWNLNPDGTKQVIHDEIASVDVFRIRVYDEKGALYAGAIREADGTVKEIDEQRGDAGYATPAAVYSFSRDIDFKNTHIGVVLLDVTDRQLQAQLTDLGWEIAIKLVVLVVLLPLVIFLTLRGLVIRPLSSLRDWVQEIHSTEMKRAPRFKRAAEINALADVFDVMSERLQESNRELRGNEELLREFIKHTPAAIAMLDREMRYLQVSDRFLTDYHLEGQNLIGKSHHEVFPDLPARWKEVHQRVLAGAVERSDEDPYVGADGQTEWLQWESLPWRKADGEIGGLILFTQVITERKRAEAAVRTSEEKFAKAFRSSPVGIAVTRLRDGVYVEVNEALARAIGYDRDELIGKSTFELGLWANLEDRQSLFADLNRHGSSHDRELTFRNRQGDAIDTQLSAELIELNGEPCVLSVVSDITERKRAERELRASEERFAKVFQLSPSRMGIIRIRDGMLLEVNDAWLRDTGYARDEVVNRPILDLESYRDPEVRARIQRMLEQGRPMRNVVGKLFTKSGEERITLTSLGALELDGEPCLVWAANDITERVRAEDALRRSEELFRAIVQDQSEMIVRWKPDGTRTFVNDAYCRVFGGTPEEFIGVSFFPLLVEPHRETLRAKIKAMTPENPLATAVQESVTREGETRWQEWTDRGIFSEQGELVEVQSTGHDITERKRAEDELRHEKEFSETVLECLPGIFFLLDENERFVRWNKNYEVVSGYSAQELRDLPRRTLVAPHHRELRDQKVKECIEQGEASGELDFLAKDGSLRRFFFNGRRFDIDGKPALLGAGIDISERKQAEDSLRSSEERFVKIFNLSPYRLAIIRISDGAVLQVNDTWVRETGFSREEVIGRPVFEFSEWLGPEGQATVHALIEAQQPIDGIETKVRHKSGEERFVLVLGELLILDGEACALWAGIDITNRKRAEEERRASERRFATAFQATPVMQTISSLDGRFRDVNESFANITGYAREEVIGHTALELGISAMSPDREKAMEKFARDGRTRNLEVPFRTRSGELRTVLWSMEKIELENQPYLLSTAIDITERKRVETELQSSEERLRALSARIQSAREEEGTRIAREIHDELGSALTGLKWDLERVDKELSKSNGSPNVPVHERITMMNSLIEETINVVRRISSELRPNMLDDLGVVAAIEWQAQQIHKRTGLIYHWDSHVDTVNLSRERATAVFRIFQEITTNVLRHSAARNFFVELRQTDEHFVLQVKDDGRGITDMEKRNTRSLGLLGMKERALLVGGEVEIVGAPNCGTTVTVRVPL